MIPEKITKAFNEQVQKELFSAYLYLSMSAYFLSEGLDGFAQWMRAQAFEELIHGMKFFDHIAERDGRIKLEEVEKPQFEWDSPIDAFKASLKHEQFITGEINKLARLSEEENDYASKSLLQWFVDEQVEEESSVSKVLQQLEMVKNSPHGLLMIDKELGARVPHGPDEGEE
jgi:ferritin